MCRFCGRIEHLERELAFMKGKESTEATIGRQALEIAELKAIIGDLRTDLKICKKPDGQVFLQPSHLAAPYIAQPHAIAAHAPVVDVKRVRGDFDDPVSGGCNYPTGG